MRNDRMTIDHRRPALSQQLPIDPSIGQAPFTVEYSYYNCTGSTVILSLRNGLRLVIKSANSLTTSGFTIRVMYKFSQHTAERLCTYLANKDCPPDDPLFPFKEGLITRPNRQGSRYVVTVDYRIERKEFGMNDLLHMLRIRIGDRMGECYICNAPMISLIDLNLWASR